MIRRYTGTVVDGAVRKSIAMILVGTLVMGALSLSAMYGMSMMVDAEGWWGRFILLMVGVGIGTLSYVIGARVFGMEEWGWVLRGRSGKTAELKGDSR